MTTHITICRDICAPVPMEYTSREDALESAVLAPCNVITETCERITGDALLPSGQARTGRE